MSVFTLDGRSYSVSVTELQRKGAVLDGDNTKRAKSGRMLRDIIGTYYNYSMTLDTQGLSLADYDALYEVLTAPAPSHSLTVPYGQGTATFDAYVSNASDVLKLMSGGRNLWGDLKIDFIAMAPKRYPT